MSRWGHNFISRFKEFRSVKILTREINDAIDIDKYQNKINDLLRKDSKRK